MGEGVLTQPFPRLDGEIRCGEVSAEVLARRFGTPLYVYDLRRIRERVHRFRAAFEGTDHLLAYSVKANGNLTLLRQLRDLGCGADVTSAGELYRARRAGIEPSRILFAGVGKTEEEIITALREGIYAFNVESEGELRHLDEVSCDLDLKAPFAIRVNPDVLSPTPHEYTATGHATTKFGVPLAAAADLYGWAASRPHLAPRGIDVHIGSQIIDPAPYLEALERVLALTEEVAAEGMSLEFVDIGGGYGISYDEGPEMDLEALARQVIPLVQARGLKLVIEPGRSIVGDAGILLTRVLYVKRNRKVFVIVDGGMSELIRPSHYGGYHVIERVDGRISRPRERLDVVGPLCESGDFLARDREMEVPEPGELLAVRTVGAYGFTMSSNYNGRLRPAECLVDGDTVRLVRRRETLEDLVRGEE